MRSKCETNTGTVCLTFWHYKDNKTRNEPGATPDNFYHVLTVDLSSWHHDAPVVWPQFPETKKLLKLFFFTKVLLRPKRQSMNATTRKKFQHKKKTITTHEKVSCSHCSSVITVKLTKDKKSWFSLKLENVLWQVHQSDYNGSLLQNWKVKHNLFLKD